MCTATIPDFQMSKKEHLACSASDMGIKDASMSYLNNAQSVRGLC